MLHINTWLLLGGVYTVTLWAYFMYVCLDVFYFSNAAVNA